MGWSIHKKEIVGNCLKKVFDSKNPKYTVTCTGKVMAITEDTLTDEFIDNLGIGRIDAFNGSDYICIDKEMANAIADILEGRDDWEWTPFQKEAVESLFDAVNGIQYQSMIKWFNEYRETNKEENK